LSAARIRAATPADAPEIARVHVQAWRESYRDMMPAATLEALSVERNARNWASILDHGEKNIVLVAEIEAEVVGFGSACLARSEALGATGEVTSIYLLDHVKRLGIGRELFASLMRALVARGHRSAGLWVLIDNHGTRRFYETLGGRTGASRIVAGSHGDLHEIAYVWDDLSQFADPG